MQEFQIPHFTTRDPLCEKYYDLSPYGYCAGNPMRYVDPDGKEYGMPEWFSVQNFDAGIYGRMFSGYPVIHIPQFILEHLSTDSYVIRDDPQKKKKTGNKTSSTDLPIPILTTLGTAAEAFGTTVISYIGPFFIILTLQGDSSPKRTVDEAADSSKNERHGDSGRAIEKEKDRLEGLELDLKNAKTKKEREQIKQKIRNIREAASKKQKGEEHGRTGR